MALPYEEYQIAFGAGARAYAENAERESNPHPEGSGLWQAWEDGWDEAADDRGYSE